MTIELLVFGVVMIVCGYLIGVKKLWQLLAGVQIKRAKNPEKTANFLATLMLIVGAFVVTMGVVGITPAEMVLTPVVFVLLLAVLYVNVKMMR